MIFRTSFSACLRGDELFGLALFVHAQAFVVGSDLILAAPFFRDIEAMDFKVIAVRSVEIDLCPPGARTGQRTDEWDPPFIEMLDPLDRRRKHREPREGRPLATWSGADSWCASAPSATM